MGYEPGLSMVSEADSSGTEGSTPAASSPLRTSDHLDSGVLRGSRCRSLTCRLNPDNCRRLALMRGRTRDHLGWMEGCHHPVLSCQVGFGLWVVGCPSQGTSAEQGPANGLLTFWA